MQSTQNRPSPREVDSRRRGSQHYYADVYDNLEQQAGGVQRSPVREGAPKLPQHQGPIEPGIPVANNASYRSRGVGADMSRPPSYSMGAPHEELLNKTNEAVRRRQEQQQLQQQQVPQQPQQQQQPASRRRGYRRTDESGDQEESPTTSVPSVRDRNEIPISELRTAQTQNRSVPTTQIQNQSVPAPYKQSLPNTRSRADPVPAQQSPRMAVPMAKARYERNGAGGGEGGDSNQPVGNANAAGNDIPRLNSPSVMSSVLKPLNEKMMQYTAQMDEAQSLMDSLDGEILRLQSRRMEAEKVHMAAKSKHDDYKRQYQGVERAMRGEPDMSFSRLSVESERPSTQQTIHAQPRRGDMGRVEVERGMRSRTESWNSLGPEGGKRESKGFNIRNLFSSG
ncbi:hypothetical protein VTL71DRAFT_5516 [Oculimacula yallundae]|uniref:Uncharacterized protein n=1 Tax=Oculimacula yallundae TaxID=86028 RepID=A0ABR4C2H3_9HELO